MIDVSNKLSQLYMCERCESLLRLVKKKIPRRAVIAQLVRAYDVLVTKSLFSVKCNREMITSFTNT